MDDGELNTRLSRIVTRWSLVRRAHDGDDAELDARRVLLERYQRAVFRYLLRALESPESAEDVLQDFAVRFLRGDFRAAEQERGRFRYYLKKAVIHLIRDHRRKEGRIRGVRLEEPDRLRAAEASVEDFDEAFVSSWREELLAKAWETLREIERDAGRPYYAFLRARSENPAYTSAQLAAVLTADLSPDEPYTAAGVRKVLQRARERFARALVAEVEFSVSSRSSRDVTEELIELGLLEYCKPVLEKGERPS